MRMRVPFSVYMATAVALLVLGMRKAFGNTTAWLTGVRGLYSQRLRFLLVVFSGDMIGEYIVSHIDVLVCSSVLTTDSSLIGKGERFLDFELRRQCRNAVNRLQSSGYNYLVVGEAEFNEEPGITRSMHEMPDDVTKLVAPLIKGFQKLPRRVS